MSKKWQYLFYGLQFVWCVWLVATMWGLVGVNPTWYNVSALTLAVLLLIYWFWAIYRVAKPKVTQLDFVVEEKEEGSFWVTLNGKTKAGPFSDRREAYAHIIDTVKETK